MRRQTALVFSLVEAHRSSPFFVLLAKEVIISAHSLPVVHCLVVRHELAMNNVPAVAGLVSVRISDSAGGIAIPYTEPINVCVW